MPTLEPDQPLVCLRQLIFLHTIALVEFGGADGIRDRGLLESALARPLAGFGPDRLYVTPFARIATLAEALIRNRGFVDGNKRTAVLAAGFWLEREGYLLVASQSDIVDTALAVAERTLSLDALAVWLEENSVPVD